MNLRPGYFALYYILIIASLILYGFWLASNDSKDEIIEIILMIIIGLAFVSGFFLSFNALYVVTLLPSLYVFVLALTFIRNVIRHPLVNGIGYRNCMLGLGIASIIPAFLLYLSSSDNYDL